MHLLLVCEKKFPRLITLDKLPMTKFSLSKIGKEMGADNYTIPYKYVTLLVKTYSIKKDNTDLWQEICTNNLFDIWEPTEPHRLLLTKKKPKIGLFRIYKIKEEFDECEIITVGTRGNHRIIRDDLNVTLMASVVGPNEFKKTQSLSDSSIKKYEI
jgi:hypothetical protein